MVKTLGKLGKDVWNNSIEYVDYQDGNYILSVSEKDQISPTFILNSETSRGSIISSSYSKYSR